MANLITTKDVFDFMGTDQGQRDKQNTAVANIIERKQKELESILRRKLESQTATNLVIHHGKGCQVYDDELYLKGVYRDFYSITALSEESTSLTESTDYDDGNDYIPDYGKGIIKRVGDTWSKELNAFKISGSYGYLNSNNGAREDIKQILIEMVAAASGLWYTEYQSEQGNVRQQRHQITKTTESMIKNHINYGL